MDFILLTDRHGETQNLIQLSTVRSFEGMDDEGEQYTEVNFNNADYALDVKESVADIVLAMWHYNVINVKGRNS